MVLTKEKSAAAAKALAAEGDTTTAHTGDKRTAASDDTETATTTSSSTKPSHAHHTAKAPKVTEPEDEGHEEEAEEEAEEDDEEGDDGTTAAKKRGRGRPASRGRGRGRGGKGAAAAGKKASPSSKKGAKSSSASTAAAAADTAAADAAGTAAGPTFKDIIEKGRVFFFYRPRVGHDEVHSDEDIQRMYMELSPDRRQFPRTPEDASEAPKQRHQHGRAPGHKKRLFIIPRKHLPNVHSPAHTRHQMHWGFVDMVADTQEEINQYLEGQMYQTKTRGNERVLYPARCVGEGIYEIVMHHGAAHLAFVLTDPVEPGEAQKDLNIFKEGSFVLRIKNPTNPTPMHQMNTQFAGFRGLGEAEHTHYSKELQESFKSKAHPDHELRFASDENVPKMLDIRHTEILLIAASDDIVKELSLAGKILEDKAERMIDYEQSAHMSSETHVRADLHLPATQQGAVSSSAEARGHQDLHAIDTHPVTTRKLE